MPTGYTYPVADGTVTDFSKFALNCSRAFGVLMHMRDEPADAPIPDKIEPTSYYKEQLDALTARRKEILDYTEDQITEQINQEYEASLEYRKKDLEETDAKRLRYMDMLAKVEAWMPPTDDHEPLKAFMIEQLRSSVEWDCGTTQYTIPNKDKKPEVWRTEKLSELDREITYYTQQYDQDLENTAAKNKWLKELRDSLNGAYVSFD